MKKSKPESPIKHATVVRDGHTVPLIGIPEDAVLEKCDSCGKKCDMTRMRFMGTQMVCFECVPADPPY